MTTSTTTPQQSTTSGSISAYMIAVGIVAAVIGAFLWHSGVKASSFDDSTTVLTIGVALVQIGSALALLGLHAVAVRQH